LTLINGWVFSANEMVSAVFHPGNPHMGVPLFPIALQREIDVLIIQRGGDTLLRQENDTFLQLILSR